MPENPRRFRRYYVRRRYGPRLAEIVTITADDEDKFDHLVNHKLGDGFEILADVLVIHTQDHLGPNLGPMVFVQQMGRYERPQTEPDEDSEHTCAAVGCNEDGKLHSVAFVDLWLCVWLCDLHYNQMAGVRQ